MQKIIMLKYAELNTKKANIGMFLHILKQNIEEKIGNFANIEFDKGRMFIKTEEENYSFVLNSLKKIFGIHEIEVGYQIENTKMSLIEESLIKI